MARRLSCSPGGYANLLRVRPSSLWRSRPRSKLVTREACRCEKGCQSGNPRYRRSIPTARRTHDLTATSGWTRASGTERAIGARECSAQPTRVGRKADVLCSVSPRSGATRR